jgi:replicative DNA helicase
MREVPGFDPDREPISDTTDYPIKNLNAEVLTFVDRLTDDLRARFYRFGISDQLLADMEVGSNGRYLTYPYMQGDGNFHSVHCVHPDKPDDRFWHGNERFSQPQFRLYNSRDIECCENGALILAEGEDNLLALKELGLPGIAVPTAADLEQLDVGRLAYLRTIFIWVNHCPESEISARTLATRLGYRSRLIRWPEHTPKNYTITQLAQDLQKEFRATAFDHIRKARSFSPFASPEKEHLQLVEHLEKRGSNDYHAMRSGFTAMDEALGSIHGITIMGGTPKSGKSNFFIQVSTEMAMRRTPVIYYDFENGRQKIYHRTLARLSRLSIEQLTGGNLDPEEQERLEKSKETLRETLPWFRVVTDRQLTPELMRRHIDFLRHETNNEYTLVVIDSLHKLPFKNFSERRTGIDAWLRQLEAIRDELQVSFLVISELSRGADGIYDEQPHMGSFKGSGDIEYSADNAMILRPEWNPYDTGPMNERINGLWLVASREQTPGKISDYRLDYPFWGFEELAGTGES